MAKRLAVLAATVALFAAAPVAVAEEPGTVSGAFRLTLAGEVPENVSFYVEDDLGGGVICTTDAAMVEAGYAECAGGGAANELAFEAPAGEEFRYRILGSRGAELSEFVVAEGSATAEEGLVVGASYAFAAPEATVARPEPSGDEATTAPTADQYDGGAAEVPEAAVREDGGAEAAADARSGDPTGGSGLLPDTGGFSVLLAGGVLLAVGGSFLARCLLS